MSECQHTSTTETQGDTWQDCHGKPHTVVYLKCANRGCGRYGKTVRVRIEGDDTPTRYRMPPPSLPMRPFGGKP